MNIRLSIFIIIIITALALGAIGMYFFELYQGPLMTSAALKQCQKVLAPIKKQSAVISVLKSGSILFIELSGTVKRISNNSVAISTEDKKVVNVSLDESSVKVYSITRIAGIDQSALAKLSDIKVGAKVIIYTKLSSGNQFVGYSIAISQ